MSAGRQRTLFTGAVVLLGLTALAVHWISVRRPLSADRWSSDRFVVTSPEDRGPGTLRQAIFDAARIEGRVEIALDVPVVELRSPLPPLVNAGGVVLRSLRDGAVIDGSGLPSGTLLDVRAPQSTIEQLTFRSAAGVALRIDAGTVLLRRLGFDDCAVGLQLGPRAAATILEESRFTANRIGVRALSASLGTTIRRVEFSGHREAAIWMTAPAGSAGRRLTRIEDNRFENDEISVLLSEISAAVERNEIIGAQTAGIYLSGNGAAVRSNRVRSGSIGIVAASSANALIETNEIDNHSAAGVLVNSSKGGVVSDNRIHGNANGLLCVFDDALSPTTASDNLILGQRHDGIVVVGGSPLLRANTVRGNGGAAFRVLDFESDDGSRLASRPLIETNEVDNNGTDSPVRGIYVDPTEPAEP